MLALPIRPMVVSSNGLDLYAVNTHASVVQYYANLSWTPTQTFPTPRSPVSIAFWDDPDAETDPERLLVVCRGTYCLAILDRATGTILGLLELRGDHGRLLAEPADILVDNIRNVAFISCSGSDVVAEVDLRAQTMLRIYAIPGKAPTFMCWDKPHPTDGTIPRHVLVAPLLSGNNSGSPPRAELNLFAEGPSILDFLDPTVALNGTRLPDEDLFRIVRRVDPTLYSIEAVTTGMGTIQFACGINSETGKVWQLNTEANNKDKTRQGAAAIRGDISRNRLSIATLPGVGYPPSAPDDIIDLDQRDTTVPIDTTRTVGQPYALAFLPDGSGLITGLLTDNLTHVGSDGSYLHDWKLPKGSIPRGLVYSPNTNLVHVYAWGTNKIHAYKVSTSNPPTTYTADLGYDPTPEEIRAGRERFFSAAHSEFNNASCATCHAEARMDGLAWNLSNLDLDDKGPMVTQTLAGIESLLPFHWRGEQADLEAFNDAFVEVLGAETKLTDEEFGELEAFIFSVQKPANPFQNEERVVDDAIQPKFLDDNAFGLATKGQLAFNGACTRCHNFPSGTNNDYLNLGPQFQEQHPRRTVMKVTPFNEMYRKEQDADPTTIVTELVCIDLNGFGTFPYVLLGAGLAHAGLVPNLHGFLKIVENTSPINEQDARHLTAFIHQWDQGVAPAVHRGLLLSEDTYGTEVADDFEDYFIAQAESRNCDLAVFGTSTLGGSPVSMRWFYQRNLSPPDKFVPEDSTFSPRSAAFFLSQAASGEGSNVVLGMPVGTGEIFSVDYDGDGLYNADEIAANTDPYEYDLDLMDTTAPVMERAVVEFVTARVARINVQTDEPTRVTVNYNEGVQARSKTSERLAKTHSILLTDLLPSTAGSGNPKFTYDVEVVAKDGMDNTASPVFLSSFTTGTFSLTAAVSVIGHLDWDVVQLSIPTDEMTATVDLRVDRYVGGPPAVPREGVVSVARLFVNGNLDSTFTVAGASRKFSTIERPAATSGWEDFDELPGPFLVSSTTNAQGWAVFDFGLGGLAVDDVVTLNIELVGPEETTGGDPGKLSLKNTVNWNMPGTPKSNRKLEFTIP